MFANMTVGFYYSNTNITETNPLPGGRRAVRAVKVPCLSCHLKKTWGRIKFGTMVIKKTEGKKCAPPKSKHCPPSTFSRANMNFIGLGLTNKAITFPKYIISFYVKRRNAWMHACGSLLMMLILESAVILFPHQQSRNYAKWFA